MSYSLTTIREIVGDVLVEFGKNNEKIFVIDSDLSGSTTTNKFQREFPERFVETGISEQNAMSIATGLASEGKIPFYANFAIFVSGTCWTQVRQACYDNSNIKIIATHPGMDGGYDGASHHANEDIALMRVLPNMTILSPSNHDEFRESVRLALEIVGPVYIRTARDVVPNLPSKEMNVGKLVVTNDEGKDFCLIYEGSTADLAFRSFNILKSKGLKGKTINIFSIKPLDVEALFYNLSNVNKVVVLENHSVLGGLYSLISEYICKLNKHVNIMPVGVEDKFTESGSSNAVKEKYGLNTENVVNKIL